MTELTTTDDYLVREIGKSQAEILDLLDKMKEQIESIDAQSLARRENRISEDGADILVSAHEGFAKLRDGVAQWQLFTLLMQMLGKAEE